MLPIPGVRYVDPRTLKNHSLNIELYGEDVPAHLLDSIKQHGVRDPLLVCKSSNIDLDGVVVSGRRRRIAAIKSGLKEVPILDWKCDDPDELEQNLIIHNIRAELTVEQRARMAAKLMEIEGRIADKRKRAGVVAPKIDKGSSVSKAAAHVGMSPSTTARAIKAVEKVDELRASGQEEKAAAVVKTLNKGKVTAALRESESKPPEEPKKDDSSKAVTEKIALVVKHERLFREAVVATMLALDAKHKADPEFSRFAKFESILRSISESQERPKVEAGRLNTEWNRFLSKEAE